MKANVVAVIKLTELYVSADYIFQTKKGVNCDALQLEAAQCRASCSGLLRAYQISTQSANAQLSY